jgi:hypothetical protein
MTNTIVVTTAADSGVGSLRAAIATATTGTTIQFAPSLANQTIQLPAAHCKLRRGNKSTLMARGLRD